MAIQDFDFASQKSSNPANKQSVLAISEKEDMDCLSSVLKKNRYHVIGKSHQVGELVELLRKHKNGIFFLDFDIKALASMDFLSKIKINCPGFKIVLMAKLMDKTEVASARKAGVVGFLAKPLNAGAVEKLLAKPVFD